MEQTVERIEAELEALHYDGAAANFRCILDVETPARQRYAELLKALEAAPGGSSWAQALRGKVLIHLGRLEEARDALNASLDALPAARARTWLAETYLLDGRFEQARGLLERALAESPESPWPRFLRAASEYGLGRSDAAEEDLRALLAQEAASDAQARAAAAAFLGLLLSARGESKQALAQLDGVVAAYPEQAWPYALRAMAHKAARDPQAAARDLEAALAKAPAGWIHLERSRLHEESGDLNAALEHIDRAVGLDGPRAEALERRAHIQICRRHYPQALADYNKVVDLYPGRLEAHRGRARVELMRGHVEAALGFARQAEALSSDPQLRFERLRAQTLAGGGETSLIELRAFAAERPRLRARVAFETGCCHLKSRRYPQAAAAYKEAMEAAEDGQLARKAEYYRCAALMLEAPPGRRESGQAPLLSICGLGMVPPFTASAGVLRAVARCGMIFNNHSEPEIAELLQLLAPAWRPTAFDILGGSEWTRVIFSEIRPGRTVGFVTRGHPLVCGGLAANLISESRRRGTSFELHASVSSMDVLAHLAWNESGMYRGGNQVLEYSTLLREPCRLDPRLPAVIYFSASIFDLPREAYEGFCAALERLYGPGHEALFYGRRFDVDPVRTPLKDLRASFGKIDPSFTLVVPPP